MSVITMWIEFEPISIAATFMEARLYLQCCDVDVEDIVAAAASRLREPRGEGDLHPSPLRSPYRGLLADLPLGSEPRLAALRELDGEERGGLARLLAMKDDRVVVREHRVLRDARP